MSSDADAADEQRHPRDPGPQRRHCPVVSGATLAISSWVDHEVVRVTAHQLMPSAQRSVMIADTARFRAAGRHGDIVYVLIPWSFWPSCTAVHGVVLSCEREPFGDITRDPNGCSDADDLSGGWTSGPRGAATV